MSTSYWSSRAKRTGPGGPVAIAVVLAFIGIAHGQNPDDGSVTAALEAAADYLMIGQPEAALDQLATVERAEPDNPWMWFYRGTARLELRDPHQAMLCYDHALDILAKLGDPEPGLANNIRLHRARARRQVFNVSLQTGLAFDTNVTYVGEATTGTADLISGQEDGKFASEFRLDYAFIANETQTLALGSRLNNVWHFSVESFDYQDYGGYVSYARRVNKNLEPAIRYDYDISYLGNEPFLSNHMLTPSLTWHWDHRGAKLELDQSSLYYQFEARDFLFQTAPEFDRDGCTHSVGIHQSFLLNPLPGWTWNLNAGYRLTSIITEGTEFDRLTHDFGIGVGVPLVNPAKPTEYLLIPDKELMFRFDAQWHLAHYRENSLIDSDGGKRQDLITTFCWTLSQKLVEDPDLGDITLNAIIHWTDAESSVAVQDERWQHVYTDPFTYDKVVYGVQLRWQW